MDSRTDPTHYLSPAAFTARYAARPGEAAQLEAWLAGQGFSAIRADPGRSYVRATAAVARIEAAGDLALDETALPETCPWTAAQVLDTDFWPEADSP